VLEHLDSAGTPRKLLIYRAGVLTRGEFDTDGNGQIDQWLFYDAEGTLIRAEYDQNGDSRADQWEYFAAGSQKPYKVERDTKGDGKADAVREKRDTPTRNRR
jgi:hypothetical protein